MKDSFVMYTKYLRHIQKLSMEQRGELLTAILCYASDIQLPELDPAADMAFSFIQDQMDKDYATYMDKCDKRREAGKLGGRPKANGFSEKQEKAKKANGFSEKQNNPDNDNECDSDNDLLKESKEKKPRFSPPTLEEAKEYANEHGYTKVDVERFIDYYTGNGWMVGKNKMKDWKACLRNWNRSQRQEMTTKGKQEVTAKNRFNNFNQRGYDYDQLEKTLLSTNGGMNE